MMTDDALNPMSRYIRRERISRRKSSETSWNDRAWGPWHVVDGYWSSTALCGASMYKANKFDKEVQGLDADAEHRCRKCERMLTEGTAGR